jgi:hypothetical protein
MAMARGSGITQHSQAAGGCLLTDEHFAKKAKDLFAHEERASTKDMELLAIGRHFRVGPHTKIILGRNELENLLLEGHAATGYTCIRPKFAGPAALVAGEQTADGEQLAVCLIMQHTKEDKRPAGQPEFWMNGMTWTAAYEDVPAQQVVRWGRRRRGDQHRRDADADLRARRL